jgi:hypothetical protein
VHRSGIIACHFRAAEWRHKEIELAAHRLLWSGAASLRTAVPGGVAGRRGGPPAISDGATACTPAGARRDPWRSCVP